MKAAGNGVSSMDWRFLPELPASGHALLLCPNMPAAVDAGLADNFTLTLLPHSAPLPHESTLFDLIALPDGLRAAPLLPQLARRLKPDGALYLSFASPWQQFGRLHRRTAGTSSLRRARQQLTRAGLQPIAVYAALPDHLHPVYLCPLTSAALQHVFRQTLSSKFTNQPAHVQRILTHPLWLRPLVHFLPAYAVIGKAAAGSRCASVK